MEITITATEANRRFSAMLRGVRKGNRYSITSRGEVVAVMGGPRLSPEQEEARSRKAWEKLKKRLKSQPVLNLPRFTRDQMHER